MAERADPKWVLVAQLVRPHGRRGELVAEILTDFPERFHDRTRLVLIPPERVATRPREIELENFWFLRSRIVLKFRGVDSINEAETLRGFAVAIPFAERAPLEAGSVYLSDLIGCQVVDLNRGGADVGLVVDVDRESSNVELLLVRPAERNAGREVLIPFVREYPGPPRCGQPAAGNAIARGPAGDQRTDDRRREAGSVAKRIGRLSLTSPSRSFSRWTPRILRRSSPLRLPREQWAYGCPPCAASSRAEYRRRVSRPSP